ncbi:hypothetical protein KsCSTR_23740 [Candidatus Kuenenia stuttgartiensis]|uniref:Uncharacterized protein n=1 Tax=Kuenenia stuttgartiensis TaxID=174633 RepID=Q1Q3P7_KUEST|nr:hypothetical protein KsCSTR_23740 [Candidatus Kuenenia stuttgartiensis]CAJ74646.1 unknown protein [Candidatus Kuenenia stuttgartiensis]
MFFNSVNTPKLSKGLQSYTPTSPLEHEKLIATKQKPCFCPKCKSTHVNFTLHECRYRRLPRYYKRKSQRRSKLYNRGAFKELVNRYGLIDPTKYVPARQPVKA